MENKEAVYNLICNKFGERRDIGPTIGKKASIEKTWIRILYRRSTAKDHIFMTVARASGGAYYGCCEIHIKENHVRIEYNGVLQWYLRSRIDKKYVEIELANPKFFAILEKTVHNIARKHLLCAEYRGLKCFRPKAGTRKSTPR